MPRYDPDGPGTNPVLAKTGQMAFQTPGSLDVYLIGFCSL